MTVPNPTVDPEALEKAHREHLSVVGRSCECDSPIKTLSRSCRAEKAQFATGLTAYLSALTPEPDTERWRKLVRLAKAWEPPYSAGLILASAPANEHDKAWASVQLMRWENPTQTLWIYEAESLQDAIDAVPDPNSRLPLPSSPEKSNG